MCGIIGYIGNKQIENILLDGLKKLEYRGYDSAGLCVLKNNKFKIIKSVGNISKLEKKVTSNSISSCGIGHTRWATHGKPCNKNTHPHISQNGNISVVHNGIIENYNDIKNELTKNNFSFKSDTDTEVIANLIEKNYSNEFIKSIINSCKQLKGSYALCVLNKKDPNTIYLAKNKSPLYIAKNEDEVFIASDPSCFVGKATKYFELLDLTFCKATSQNITFYNIYGKQILLKQKEISDININTYDLKTKYHMQQEIMQSPQVIKNIVNVYSIKNYFSFLTKKFLDKFNRIYFIGCGSAYHVSMYAEYLLEQNLKIFTKSYIASEFLFNNVKIDKRTLCVFISQSGETADTLLACDLCNKNGATCIALTNVEYSTLAKKCKFILPVCAGQEISVASTKAYTAQMAIVFLLQKHLLNLNYQNNNQPYKNLLDLAKVMQKFNSCHSETISNLIYKSNSVLFLGKNYDYITCREASLKLKEITYINSQDYPAGELKHGFIALIDNKSICILIATQKRLLPKALSSANEIIARGGKVVLITPFDVCDIDKNKLMCYIKTDKCNIDLMPLYYGYIFQNLAYSTCIKKGLNPDQPRNLAKSVTVE